jgi:hypothetical protein
VHLQLFDLARAIDVVGQGVAPCVRMSSDKIPPGLLFQIFETKSFGVHVHKQATADIQNVAAIAQWAYWSPIMGVTSISNLKLSVSVGNIGVMQGAVREIYNSDVSSVM